MSIICGFSRKIPSAAHFNMIKRVIVCWECYAIVFCDRFYDWLMRWFVVFVFWVFLIERFGLFFLVLWFDWLFRLVVFYWTVVILWERRRIKVWRCIATLLLLNSMSKWVRSDPCGCFFWFWWVLFVVKTFSCSERRFASGTS